MNSTGLAFAALAAASGGAVVLRLAWRRKTKLQGAIVTAGWLALILAVILSAAAFGAEVGPPVILTAFSLAGIVLVLGNIEWRRARIRTPRGETQDPADNTAGWTRFLFHLLSLCILTGIAAFLAFIVLARCLFPASPNAVLFGAFTLLLLWSLVAIWVSADRRVFRMAALLLCIAGLSYAASFVAGICA